MDKLRRCINIHLLLAKTILDAKQSIGLPERYLNTKTQDISLSEIMCFANYYSPSTNPCHKEMQYCLKVLVLQHLGPVLDYAGI